MARIDMLHTLIDILRNSILITGLVVVMMMMIESLNIESKGMFFKGLRKTRTGQVVIGALLGSVPGCMGGFATVSLYTHRMFSFGALVAMMIASSGDEAFVMLAMIPDKALVLFAILFVIAVLVGIITDKVYERIHTRKCSLEMHEDCGIDEHCQDGYAVHEDHAEAEHSDKSEKKTRHYGWKRISMFIGLAVFIAALATGKLGHDHESHAHGNAHTEHVAEHHDHSCCDHSHSCQEHGHEGKTFHINLLSEEWMNVLFAGLSVIVLFVLLLGSDHFVEEHLWNHIVRRHLPTIFAWTFGVLLVLGIMLQYIDIDRWISSNTVLMILLATLIGIIPESGPHMIFVTLYAAGVVPFPVLLASSISQDGHASIPLLAENRKSFAWAKLINCIVALTAGLVAMLF
ncbi:MAG: arsenic efflux protein [Bacteroidales bacterium]|nr:arsenic efflux protein [Bacteroidales bacterium]